MPEKITVDEVNRLDESEFVARFGSLFEHSPWVAEGAWHERPFGSLSELRQAFRRSMYGAPKERQLDLIRAHPDLAGRAAVAGKLTPESKGEQSSAGLDRLSSREYEEFNLLNAAYREKFGFPMIFAVREHTKESILSGAEARLGHSRPKEMETALGEIAKIADFRLQDYVGPDDGGGSGAKAEGDREKL